MSLQNSEIIELSEIKVSNARTMVFTVPHVGASMVVMLYDVVNKVGGIAHIVLPESTLNTNTDQPEGIGKYADTAIPELLKQYAAAGGQTANTIVRISGGAQLFNFGGGSGNLLNIGSRNATAIKTALSRQGLAVDKEDVGGNKARSLRFVLLNGQVMIRTIGGQEQAL